MGGNIPKQYLSLADATVLEHSLAALLACDWVERIALVLKPGDAWVEQTGVLAQEKLQRVDGGAQRSDSVLAGLEYLSYFFAEDDWVLVHDAARPCLTRAELEALVDEVSRTAMGTLLATPVTDTVKQLGQAGLVDQTVDRSRLWCAQTPQMFRLGPLRRALIEARNKGLQVTDEASAMELAGHPVRLLQGPRSNIKITLAQDLKLAEWYLQDAVNSGEAG